MNKRMIKVMILFFLFLLFIAWGYQVYQVNCSYHLITQVYAPGDSLDFGDYRITNLGGEVITVSEFNLEYNKEITEENQYVVCLQIRLQYIGENKIDLQSGIEDIVNTFTINGFRTDTWSNGINPFMFQNINITDSFLENYIETKECELLLVTFINPETMRKDNYDKYRSLQYYYVLDTYPVNIRLLVNQTGEK